jgi:hypothetical protein
VYSHRAVPGGSFSLTHKYEETTSHLKVEKWENNGKSGYAIGIKRGDNSVNIVMAQPALRHIAKVLDELSVSQAWTSYRKSDGSVTDSRQLHPVSDGVEDDDVPFE